MYPTRCYSYHDDGLNEEIQGLIASSWASGASKSIFTLNPNEFVGHSSSFYPKHHVHSRNKSTISKHLQESDRKRGTDGPVAPCAVVTDASPAPGRNLRSAGIGPSYSCCFLLSWGPAVRRPRPLRLRLPACCALAAERAVVTPPDRESTGRRKRLASPASGPDMLSWVMKSENTA